MSIPLRHENGANGGGKGERTQYDKSSGIEFTQSRAVTVCPTFEAMGLKPELLRGIYSYGFEKPSAIQQRAIKPIIQGRDVIAQSQSGTGKTAVFSISALQIVNQQMNETQVLIVSPTRELAEQTTKVISAIGDFTSVRCHGCIGGKSVGEDLKALDSGVQVVSGTPGRIFDMIRRQNLRTQKLKCLIIDEADEMLSRGFKEQVRKSEGAASKGKDPCPKPTRSSSRSQGRPARLPHLGCESPRPFLISDNTARRRSTTSTDSCRPQPRWYWCQRRSPTRSSR